MLKTQGDKVCLISSHYFSGLTQTPILPQKLDRKICLAGQRHETPGLPPGVQVSAAENLPTHSAQHPRSRLGPGAEVEAPLRNWAIVSVGGKHGAFTGGDTV